MPKVIALALLTLLAAAPASAQADLTIGDIAVANQLDAVANDLAGVGDQFASVVYRLQYPNPGPPTYPPDPGSPTVAFVNQLAAMVVELTGAEGRMVTAYPPDPGVPPSPIIADALFAIETNALAIVNYPSPGPPQGTELTDVGLALLQVRGAAQEIADLAQQLLR